MVSNWSAYDRDPAHIAGTRRWRCPLPWGPERLGPITTRLGYCSWNVDHAGWVVTLHSPDEQDFYGQTLEEGRAWCLMWLMVPNLGIEQFLV